MKEQDEVVIPSQPGWSIVHATREGEDWHVYRVPVVAWKVEVGEYCAALPITIETEPDEGDVILEAPNGEVFKPEIQQWRDIKSYMRDVEKEKTS